MSDTATHVVPEPGLASWPAPDANAQQGPLVPARLEVVVVEWSGAWAHIRCTNGWTTWVDGRLLLPLAAPPPVPPPPLPPPPPPSAPAAPPGAPAAPPSARSVASGAGLSNALNAGAAVGVGPLSIVGAALVLLASFLPWYQVVGVGLSAWDVPVSFLVTGGAQLNGVKVGLLLVAVAGIVALPLLTRRRLGESRLLPSAGIVAVAAGLAALLRLAVEDGPKPDIGLGVFVALAGGGLITYECLRGRS
ncbi:MAG: hypothetical protein ACRDZW_09840 [Acidimicrobiales bacterium]